MKTDKTLHERLNASQQRELISLFIYRGFLPDDGASFPTLYDLPARIFDALCFNTRYYLDAAKHFAHFSKYGFLPAGYIPRAKAEQDYRLKGDTLRAWRDEERVRMLTISGVDYYYEHDIQAHIAARRLRYVDTPPPGYRPKSEILSARGWKQHHWSSAVRRGHIQSVVVKNPGHPGPGEAWGKIVCDC